MNTVALGEHAVRIEPKVIQVLVCLATNAGDVVEKDRLMRTVWPDTFVSDDALTRCVSELRKTFEDNAREARVIQTVPKIGYRLLLPVVDLLKTPGNAASAPAIEANPVVPSPVASLQPAGTPRGSQARKIAGGMLLLLVLLLAAWFSLSSRNPLKEPINSVAVLPFENATADPDADYLSDGIALSVGNTLSQIPNLKVIAQASTSYYKGKKVDPSTVGQRLGARALLTGRMMKSGDHLLVTVELVDARDDSHIWGKEYDRPAADAPALEEDIARDIAQNLRLRLTGAQQTLLARHYSTNRESHELYLRGRYLWNKRNSDSIRRSAEYFQQAIAKDGSNALAYAGLADAYNLMTEYNSVPPTDAYPKAKAAALKALELDDTLAEAHASLAMVKQCYDWDAAGSEAEYQRAIALDPNYATAHQWYSLLLEAEGKNNAAEREAQKALELDPLSLIIISNVAKIYGKQGRYDEAGKLLDKALELDPSFSVAYAGRGYVSLEQLNCPAAMEDFRKGLSLAPDNPGPLEEMGMACARCGERTKALQIIAELKARSQRQYIAPSEVAYIFAWLGNNDETIAWLQKGLAVRDDGVWHIESEQAFASLRADPRFAQFMKNFQAQL